MDKKTAPLVILAIVLCAVIVLGEVFTYGINIHSFDSKAEFSSGTLNYSVSSSGSDTYSILLMDDNGVEPINDLHIYVDERYDDYYDDVQKKSNLLYTQEQYYSEQIKKHLDFRGFRDVTLVESKELIGFINDTYENPKGHGLLVTSYALPSEIYSGNADDTLMKWINNGDTSTGLPLKSENITSMTTDCMRSQIIRPFSLGRNVSIQANWRMQQTSWIMISEPR